VDFLKGRQKRRDMSKKIGYNNLAKLKIIGGYMSRITDIFLVDTVEQEAIAIHSKVSVAEIPAIIGEGFMKLEEYIKSKGIVSSDTPFLQIIGIDPNAIEIAAGMEVPTTVHGNGKIEDFLIPAGKKISPKWPGVWNGQIAHKGCYAFKIIYLLRANFGLLTKLPF